VAVSQKEETAQASVGSERGGAARAVRGEISRREWLANAGALAAASILPGLPGKLLAAPQPLYPPTDLSYFDTPLRAGPSEIRFGYAAITWGGNDRQAIVDVAELGFRGIQLRANVLREFGENPSALRELLEQHKLVMVALSSGGLNIEAPQADELAKHIANARFVREVGGLYLQVTDTRPRGREVVREDYRKLGRLMTELGKRTADLGVPLGYHNHMDGFGERPEEVDWILEAADARYAKLELDIAHYLQGGGDPVKAIERYADRHLFLHIKDVENVIPAKPADRNYRFVELGRGRVDLPAVFAALKRVNFRGWAVVGLDAVPDPARTPKECGAISKKYLEEKLGFTI
jgi:inosose dehydratase